ncbi:tRNA-specific adenosine deaminase 1 [Entophlyctis luteolus]|nr:tRNA-specific adenosine deaminase 1 [Entophlyctis luteolus]
MPNVDIAAIAAYTALRKPEIPGRWTVLAAIGLCRSSDPEPQSEIVALATGVKCLPRSAALVGHGRVVADCHAEVLCRRAFRRYLVHQMSEALSSCPSIFSKTSNWDPSDNLSYPLILDADVRFYMYISQSPCGDASMAALESSQEEEVRQKNEAKRKEYLCSINLESTQSAKRSRRDGFNTSSPEAWNEFPEFLSAFDLSKGELVRGRNDYARVGVLRTKPGRADAEMSLSMSCSDKLAKWNAVGISGAFLSLLAAPVYLDGIIVGDLFDEQALRRAIIDRGFGLKTELKLPFKLGQPSIFQSTARFQHSKSFLESQKAKYPVLAASDIGLAWTKGDCDRPLQLLNNAGRRQGSGNPRKGVYPEASESHLCAKKLHKEFLDLLCIARNANRLPKILQPVAIETLAYKDTKKFSANYYQARKLFLEQLQFKGWVVKDWNMIDLSSSFFGGKFNAYMDLSEIEKEYILHADIPGVKKDEINISIKGNVLTISGERSANKEIKDDQRHVVERA